MSNTVSIRIIANSTTKSINQLAHDMRIKSVNYLKNEEQKNILFAKDESIIFSQSEKMKEKFEEQKNIMLQSAQEQKLIHEKVIGQKSQIKNYFIDGIITFSPDMRKDFFNNQAKFQKLAEKTLEDFSNKYGIKLLHHTIHLDEKTPHIHFSFENVNRKTGRSVQRYISKIDLKQLQTDTAKYWEEMGYKRGKENSKAKHYSVAIGHQKEELENLEKQIQEKKKIIKQQEISASEKKQELDKLDIVLKQTRIKLKQVKNLTVLDSKIEQNIDQLVKDSKKLFVLNEEKLRANLKEKLQEYSKSDFKSLQEQKLKKQVNVLINENNNLINDYNAINDNNFDLEETNSRLMQEIEVFAELENKNLSLVEENKELKSDIQELEKVYKFNYQKFKENRKSQFNQMREARSNHSRYR